MLVLTILCATLALLLFLNVRTYLALDSARKHAGNLDNIHDTVPIGMCQVSKNLTVMWMNKQIRDFYGLKKGDTGMKYEDLLDPNLVAMVKEMLDNNEQHEVISFEGGLTPDMKPVLEYEEGVTWMKLNYVPILDQAGDLESYVILNENLTNEKHSEHKLLQNNQTISSQLTEIEMLNSDLKEVNENLDKFAAMASHDLKSPLNTIQGFAKLLSQKQDNTFTEDDKAMAQFIVQGTSQMNTLIEDLLTFARLDKKLGEPVKVEASEIMDKVVFNLQNTISEKQARIVYESMPRIEVQESLVLQLFQNLVANALKFSPSKRKPRIICSTSEVDERFVQFSVADNGIGISPEKTKEIFKAFTRLHSRSQYEGTGLGLAICKKIVDFHNGRIWIESEKDVGTTVNFTLPIAKA